MRSSIANAIIRDDVHTLLIDTKRVEFDVYSKVNSNKTLVCASDYSSAMARLKLLYREMEDRYAFFAQYGKSSINDFPSLSKKLVVIDEVSDLMLQQKEKEFENLLVRIAQKGRAAGIFIILATPR